MAEGEGVEHLPITRRVLKTGRQVWSVGVAPSQQDGGDDD